MARGRYTQRDTKNYVGRSTLRAWGKFVVVGLVVAFVVWIWSYHAMVGPALRQNALENGRANREIRSKWANMLVDRADWLLALSGTVLAVCCLGGIVVYGLVAIRKQQLMERTPDENGNFPLQQHGGYLIDINTMPGYGIAYDGRMLTGETPAQIVANRMQSMVRVLTANKGRIGANAGKLIAGKWDRHDLLTGPVPGAPAGPEQNKPVRLELADAIQQSTPTRWVFGQNQTTGALSWVDITRTPHMGIIGSSGTGKTESSGFLLALYTLRSGYHLIILDGKGGLDWGAWAQHAEVHLMDSTNMLSFVQQLVALHEARFRLLQAARAKNIDQLGNIQHNVIQHVVVIIEEFGATRARLKGNKKVLAALDVELGQLLRLARATGIHLCFVDQAPEGWSHDMTANAKYKLIYKLPGLSGNVIGEYAVKGLGDIGQFARDGIVYHAWHTAEEALLGDRELPKVTQQLLEGGGASASTGFGDPGPTAQKSGALGAKSASTGTDGTTGTSVGSGSGSGTEAPLRKVKEPVTEAHKALVWETYLATGKSKNKTCKLMWGYKNQTTYGWLHGVLDEFELRKEGEGEG